MKSSNSIYDRTFFLRAGITVVAIAVLIYLANIWLIQPFFKTGNRQDGTKKYLDIISWRDAQRYRNRFVTVEGTVVATYNNGRVCFLNFHPDYKRHFTAVIFASSFPDFPKNPEQYYYGKKVRVTGYVKEYNGKPEMVLNYPKQIQIVE